jgi:hypothetical protein
LLGIHTSPFGLVRSLPQIYRGRSVGTHKAYESIAGGATLHSANNEVRYMVDGDLRTSKAALRVELGPTIQVVLNLL